MAQRPPHGLKMKLTAILLLGLLAAGCVTDERASGTAGVQIVNVDGQPVEVVCRREKPTGSNRPVKVCRRVATTLEREKAKRDVRAMQRQNDGIGRRDQPRS